jgi:hypothetical protein
VVGSSIYTGVGTAADPDGDGVADTSDNCPGVFNPIRPLDGGNQADNDSDGVGDACDVCPTTPSSTTCTPVDPNDRDSDGVVNAIDNCPDVANTDQADGDGDGKGNVCDLCPTIANPGVAGCPVTIYQIKNRAAVDVVPIGASVRVANALVTGKGANGFFVQVKDGDTGFAGADFSGLFVFTGSTSPFLPMVAPGHRVTIDGTVALFNGQYELDSVVDVMSNGTVEAAPVPVNATAAEITTGGPRAAALEGVLVRIGAGGVSAVDAGFNEFTVAQPGGGSVVVDDFLFLVSPLPTVGTQYGSVTGVLAFRNLASKLLIRSAADLGPAALGLASFGPTTSFVAEGATDVVPGPTPLTVTLNQAAPSDTFVAITSGTPAALTVTGGGVTVMAGQTTAQVRVSGLTQAAAVTLTATLGTSLTATVRVVGAAEQPTLTSLTPTTATVAPNGTVAMAVGLDLPAPAGGTTVALTASAGSTPTMVTVPAGQVGAPFTYTARRRPGWPP